MSGINHMLQAEAVTVWQTTVKASPNLPVAPEFLVKAEKSSVN